MTSLSYSLADAEQARVRTVLEYRGRGLGFLDVGHPAGGVTRNEAFDAYVLPEVEVLLRVARSLTGQPADAEDLVQDTLLRAYGAVDRFDGRHPRAWLLTIMRNAHANRLRRHRPEVLADDVAQQAPCPPGEGPEAVVLAGTFDATVGQAFGALPERFRRVVELVDFDGLSYREAAVTLDVAVGTVMSRLHRGRRRIRAMLEDAGVAPTGREQTGKEEG